jgi:hypothetical protein
MQRPTYRKTSRNRYATTLLLLIATLAAKNIYAQWDIEESHTTASLRGIHNVGGGVAWASGTNGTVLRTEDGGYLWQTCTISPGAEKLDFRGIQAFDENTAIVMSSGKGDLSRLYKTTDGCQTWKLLFTNPDKEGFWDAIQFQDKKYGVLLGDPVGGHFYTRVTSDGGLTWKHFDNDDNLKTSNPNSGVFAASNSTIFLSSNTWLLAVMNENGKAILVENSFGELPCKQRPCPKGFCWWEPENAQLGQLTPSGGVFSLAVSLNDGGGIEAMVAVGGDYQKPNERNLTASYSSGSDWILSQTPPHGYRSSVAYDPTQKLWITVGPNGTDISRDDGKNWTPLKPSGYDPPDADKNWNALSLPFVVGPHGRIGRLRTITQKPEAPPPPEK